MNEKRKITFFFKITMLINQEPHCKDQLTNYYVIRKDYLIGIHKQNMYKLLFNQRSNDICFKFMFHLSQA